MKQAIMIVAGSDFSSSSYCRLHGPVINDLLVSYGFKVKVYWTFDPAWQVTDILDCNPNLIITLKAEDDRSRQLRCDAVSFNIPVISALNVRKNLTQLASLDGVTIATAAVYNSYIKEFLAMSRFNIDDFVLIGDPPETWLPNENERLKTRQLISATPRRLLWIGRERHLSSLAPYLMHIPDEWKLDIWTDKPDKAPPGAHLWDTANARAALASADAMLITSRDDNSAPIRLINGLQVSCPVLAEPLTSYIQTCSPGYGWLAIKNPVSLEKILTRWNKRPELSQRICTHIIVPHVDIQRAAHKNAWENLIDNALNI